MVRSSWAHTLLWDPGWASNTPYLALGILNLSRQPLDHAVQLIDLLLGAAQGLPMSDHRGLDLLTLGEKAERLMKLRTGPPTHSGQRR